MVDALEWNCRQGSLHEVVEEEEEIELEAAPDVEVAHEDVKIAAMNVAIEDTSPEIVAAVDDAGNFHHFVSFPGRTNKVTSKSVGCCVSTRSISKSMRERERESVTIAPTSRQSSVRSRFILYLVATARHVRARLPMNIIRNF